MIDVGVLVQTLTDPEFWVVIVVFAVMILFASGEKQDGSGQR